MARSIDGQVVVIAGASSGIGRTTARLLAERGATVVASARSATDLSTLVEEIRSTGGSALDVVADVRSEDDMKELARVAVDRFGRIDTWVGCAAVSVYGKAWEIPAHEYDAVMRTNWLGHVHGALAALPYLRSSKGTFVAIGSVESVRAVPLHAPYTASKFALRAFCDSLRMDLDAEDAGVAVSLIMPAAIDTPFFEHSRSYADGAPKPPPPVYSPESVAEAVLRMAERPQRQVTVGGSAFGFISGQKFAPALTDRLMTARQSMLRMQQSDAPPGGRDNVDAPVEGSGAERGGHGGRRSLAAAVTTARPLVKRAAGLGAAAAGVVASRVATRQRRTDSSATAPGASAETTERRVIQLPQERTDVPDPGRDT